MKKIVGIIAAFALVAGTVFADPDLTPTITSFKGNAGLEYVANLDTEAVGFNNFSSAEFEVQFKSADWGGKSTSGDGLWGELTIRTGSEIKVKGPGNAWTVPGAEVTTAKLHFIDGDTYLHMDLLKPGFGVGEIKGRVALNDDDEWRTFGSVAPDGSFNGFQLNFGIPLFDLSFAFGDKGFNSGLKIEDQKYAYKIAATVKPLDGLAIGAAFASTTEDNAKKALAANVSYEYAINDTFYVAPFANYTKLDKKQDLSAAVLLGWGGKNMQWNHDFLTVDDGTATLPADVKAMVNVATNGTHATDGFSVEFIKHLKNANGDDPKSAKLAITAYDSVLANKVIPGSTILAAKYVADGDELDEGVLSAGLIYTYKLDIYNITAKFSFADLFGLDDDNTAMAYELKVNTTEVIQNTDLYIDWAGKKSELAGCGNNKKGTIKVGANISF